MNKHFFGALCVAAVLLMMGASWAFYHQRSDNSSLSDGALVLPGLLDDLSSVERIDIQSASDGRFTLTRSEKGWTVQERHYYPADFSAIRALLEQMSAARFYERKTAQAEHYGMLGVADVSAPNSTAVLVSVFIKNRKEPYALLVGKLATTWDGSYARLPNDAQSWLLDRQIPANGLIASWLNNEILRIEPQRIYRVTYTTPQGEKLVVERKSPDVKHFSVVNLPPGKVLRYDTVVDGVPHDFAEIVLRDVHPAAQQMLNPKAAYYVVLETYDGLRVSIQTQQNQKRYFLTVRAQFDDALAKQNAVLPLASQQSAQQAQVIEQRANGWVYEVNEHVYVDLTKTMKDVLPAKPQKNAEPSSVIADEHDHSH